jgi:hypothetical protein
MRRTEIAREIYGGYASGERAAVERHLAPDFRFFSPADPGIDLARYWERCWPGAAQLDGFSFVRLVEIGTEVLVTYEATRTDGSRFRNTEILTFEGAQAVRAEVYFGWNL